MELVNLVKLKGKGSPELKFKEVIYELGLSTDQVPWSEFEYE